MNATETKNRNKAKVEKRMLLRQNSNDDGDDDKNTETRRSIVSGPGGKKFIHIKCALSLFLPM